MKTWMVEQRWRLPGCQVVPIRSVVEARTKRAAATGAAKAVRDAVKVLIGEVRGEPAGLPVVLYPIGVKLAPPAPADSPREAEGQK